MLQNNKYMAPKEVSEQLGVHVNTLAAWREKGEGPAFYRLGGDRPIIKYETDDVKSWLAAHKCEKAGDLDD